MTDTPVKDQIEAELSQRISTKIMKDMKRKIIKSLKPIQPKKIAKENEKLDDYFRKTTK